MSTNQKQHRVLDQGVCQLEDGDIFSDEAKVPELGLAQDGVTSLNSTPRMWKFSHFKGTMVRTF